MADEIKLKLMSKLVVGSHICYYGMLNQVLSGAPYIGLLVETGIPKRTTLTIRRPPGNVDWWICAETVQKVEGHLASLQELLNFVLIDCIECGLVSSLMLLSSLRMPNFWVVTATKIGIRTVLKSDGTLILYTVHIICLLHCLVEN